MIEFVEKQAKTFPVLQAEKRLELMDLTAVKYSRLCHGYHEKVVRESAIPEEDIVAAIEFFIQHPDVGAGKAHDTLIDQELAYLSTTNLNAVKQELVNHSAKEYQQRKEEEKLLEAQLREALLAQRAHSDYQHQRANHPHHIWATDFLFLTFLGTPVALCVVYDEFSQAYMSLKVAAHADHQLAKRTLQEAFERTTQKPELIRRDNGKPFVTEEFQKLLETAITQDYPVPPHSPWYNGSLESCNTSLKAAIKTTGMQDMAESPTPYPEWRKNPDQAIEHLQEIGNRVHATLNKSSCRCKHKMPPLKVLQGKQRQTHELHQAFIAKKKDERWERMKKIQMEKKENGTPKRFIDKIVTLTRRALRKMETNTLYVFNELLHNRFRMFET